MNNETDMQNAVADAQIPPTPPEDPPQNESGDKPPRPVKRKQHYFTNLPNIGLEAQPLKAPWEENAPEGEQSEDDYDYPNGYKPAASNKAAMAIAVSVAAVLAVTVIVFLIYIFMTNKANSDAANARAATADSATETTLMTEVPSESVEDKPVTMPDLIGLEESDAYKLLNEAKVRYKVTRVYSVDVAFNRVVSQYPEADTVFMQSEEAIVYISKGRENEIITSATKPAPTKSTAPTTTPGTTVNNGDYILPDSASRQLSRSDISALDRETLNLALNEIYARHGRKFSDPDINAYFRAKSWYQPTIAAKDFDDSILNQYEVYNVKLITNYQSAMGYR